MEQGGDSRVPAAELGMAEVKDLFVVSDRRVVTLGAVKDVVLDVLPSQGVAEQSSFFLCFFYPVPQQTQITALLPLTELLHAASHTADNKLLFLKIGAAAES